MQANTRMLDHHAFLTTVLLGTEEERSIGAWSSNSIRSFSIIVRGIIQTSSAFAFRQKRRYSPCSCCPSHHYSLYIESLDSQHTKSGDRASFATGKCSQQHHRLEDDVNLSLALSELEAQIPS